MNRIRNTAFALGVNLTKQTPRTDVQDLINLLKPLDCGRELVRIGADHDGGYLLPDDFEGIEFCFSPGVGPVAEFENHLATLGIKSFMADYSVDTLPVIRPEFTFDKMFVSANDTTTSFTLDTWREKYLHDYAGDLLLQMDIEGSEYEVLLSTPLQMLSRFRIMVIEFHFLEKLFDPFVFNLYRACFQKLMQSFHVSHIHPNNCCGSMGRFDIDIPRMMEITFYNKNRIIEEPQFRKDFPHRLDRDNVPNHMPLLLPECWYKPARPPVPNVVAGKNLVNLESL